MIVEGPIESKGIIVTNLVGVLCTHGGVHAVRNVSFLSTSRGHYPGTRENGEMYLAISSSRSPTQPIQHAQKIHPPTTCTRSTDHKVLRIPVCPCCGRVGRSGRMSVADAAVSSNGVGTGFIPLTECREPALHRLSSSSLYRVQCVGQWSRVRLMRLRVCSADPTGIGNGSS